LAVASLADAWIEIMHLPLRPQHHTVASLADAWIEIANDVETHRKHKVASLADAWIEIRIRRGRPSPGMQSHPSRMRGLKSAIFVKNESVICRIPRGCVD